MHKGSCMVLAESRSLRRLPLLIKRTALCAAMNGEAMRMILALSLSALAGGCVDYVPYPVSGDQAPVNYSGTYAQAPIGYTDIVEAPIEQPPVVACPWAPPPLIIEAPSPQPYFEAFWIGGYWVWRGNWLWARGRWARPPHPGYRWSPPYYEHRNGAVLFIDGYWSAPGRVFLPPSPRMRYPIEPGHPGTRPGPRPIGPNGVFVPAPPGSRPGIIVPAPIGVAPAVLMHAPAVNDVGMRIEDNSAGRVSIIAPKQATTNAQPVKLVVPNSPDFNTGHRIEPQPARTPAPGPQTRDIFVQPRGNSAVTSPVSPSTPIDATRPPPTSVPIYRGAPDQGGTPGHTERPYPRSAPDRDQTEHQPQGSNHQDRATIMQPSTGTAPPEPTHNEPRAPHEPRPWDEHKEPHSDAGPVQQRIAPATRVSVPQTPPAAAESSSIKPEPVREPWQRKRQGDGTAQVKSGDGASKQPASTPPASSGGASAPGSGRP